jgi:DNA-binding response OmpR family regulator
MSARRILVVDDEAPIRELVREALEQQGWEVDGAADSAEALRLVKDNLYDAVVIDFVLPDMDGIRLHSEIRRLDPELGQRSLFISGLAQPDERLKYYGSDGGGFLPKPFTPLALVQRLHRILES